jgi:hypothetical protein
LIVKLPFIVEPEPKLTPVVVFTLLNVVVPDTVWVAVPEKVTACVPESAVVPEFVKVVPDVLFEIVNVFVEAVNVTPLAMTTLEPSASWFCVTLWLSVITPKFVAVGGTALAVQVAAVPQLPVAAVVQPEATL